MAIISVTQPGKITSDKLVTQIQKRKETSEVIKNKGIKIQSFLGSSSKGLSNIKLKPMRQLITSYTFLPEIKYNILWRTGWFTSSPENPRSNWSGFMQAITEVPVSEQKSSVSFLPIIDLNPSDESCIYSTLLFIEEQAKLLNVNTPCVTSDQLLGLKAAGIINDANLNIVCRLDGFHILTSFLGRVGNMMKGSGLEDLFAEAYAEQSVIHMMSGKAFSRALCAHFLTESALMTLILTIIKEDENFDRSIIDKFFLELSLASTIKQQLDGNLNTPEFEKLNQAISDTKELLSKKSRTAKLWISYVNYVATIKKFIIAERISNWELHLEAVTEMLN